MGNKKKLIRRMALVAGALLGLGLVAQVIALAVTAEERRQRLEGIRRQRAEAVESARKYLDELTSRIRRVPVDPTLVGEIQAKYFEEYPQGRKFVWAMGASGDFLFGVPREAFARLNAFYDAHEASILGEGFFVDRQDFLRRLVQASEDLEPSDLAASDRPEDAWSRWRHYGDSEGWLVLSAPLKAADGSSLGNLYLKTRVAGERDWAADETTDALLVVPGAVSGVALAFLWFLLPTWVYVDARERGVRRAMLWSFLVLISLFVGLLVYLIARPEEPRRLQCPGCGREVDGGAFCPHCGQDLASAFCATCRYPLKPDWAFCPSCRTEIRRPAAEPAATTTEG